MTRPETEYFALNRRDVLQTTGAALLTAVAPDQLWGESASQERPQIGINLAPVSYFGTERPFNNLFFVSSEHIPLRPGADWGGGGELDLDENGWIRRFQPGQYAAFLIDLGRGHRNKTVYEVLYRGAPNAVRVGGHQSNTFTKWNNEDRMIVYVHSPIRDVIVREKGFRFDEVFAQRFLDRCRMFDTIRFMNWQGTNEDRPVDWQSRVTDKYYTQAGKEVALEHMVALCNKSSAAMWYCAHHRADDDYLRQAAAYIKEHLTNGRPIYLEHSNEVWNAQFPQHGYAQEQGGDWLAYHIQRTAQIARIFRAAGVEIVSVLGLQSVNTWLTETAFEKGVPKDIDAIAIAPYFSTDVSTDETVHAILDNGVERVMKECWKSIKETRRLVRAQRELADRHGRKLLGYEGGQHLVANYPYIDSTPRLNDVLAEANRHPEMYELYRAYLRMWQEETDNALMCLYHSVGAPSKWGSWGLLEYEGQPLETAPKYRAVVDALK